MSLNILLITGTGLSAIIITPISKLVNYFTLFCSIILPYSCIKKHNNLSPY